MPLAEAVNKHVTPEGKEIPIDLYYSLQEPDIVTDDTPTLVLVAGLGAQCITNTYNNLVYPFVQQGYRVLRFDNRDNGWSTRLDSIGTNGMIFDKLKNRINAQNQANVLNFPINPKKCKINDKDHTPALDANIDYPEECFVAGSRPREFMQKEDIAKNKAPYPKPTSGGFMSAIGLGRKQPLYELYDMAMDTILLCERLKLTKNVHFLGISMGGMIVQCIAALKPSLVTSLSLVMTQSGNSAYNAAFSFVFGCFITRKQPAFDASLEEVTRFAAETQALIGTKDNTAKRFNNGQTIEQYIHACAYRSSRAEFGAMRQIDAIDSQEARDVQLDFISPRIPILVFHGDIDELVPTSNAYHFHNIIKNSYNRALNPPSLKDAELKELDIIEQVVDERLKVTTILGPVVNGKQIYHTLAILKDQAHEISDDYCTFLTPQIFSHMEAAQGKVDLNLPRTFQKLEWGTEQDMAYGCPPPEDKEVPLGYKKEEPKKEEETKQQEENKTEEVQEVKKDTQAVVDDKKVDVTPVVATEETPVDVVKKDDEFVVLDDEEVAEAKADEAAKKAEEDAKKAEEAAKKATVVVETEKKVEEAVVEEKKVEEVVVEEKKTEVEEKKEEVVVEEKKTEDVAPVVEEKKD